MTNESLSESIDEIINILIDADPMLLEGIDLYEIRDAVKELESELINSKKKIYNQRKSLRRLQRAYNFILRHMSGAIKFERERDKAVQSAEIAYRIVTRQDKKIQELEEKLSFLTDR